MTILHTIDTSSEIEKDFGHSGAGNEHGQVTEGSLLPSYEYVQAKQLDTATALRTIGIESPGRSEYTSIFDSQSEPIERGERTLVLGK